MDDMQIDQSKIDAELEYMRNHTSLVEYARYLSEAIGDTTLIPLALLLRIGGNNADAEVRAEIERIFNNYWTRQIRRRIENEARKYREES